MSLSRIKFMVSSTTSIHAGHPSDDLFKYVDALKKHVLMQKLIVIMKQDWSFRHVRKSQGLVTNSPISKKNIKQELQSYHIIDIFINQSINQ